MTVVSRRRSVRRRIAVGLMWFTVLMCGGIAVVGPYVRKAQEDARRSNCKCSLKQLGLAFYNYHDTYGSFPPAIVLGPDGSLWHSWRVLLLPYLEQQELYAKYKFSEPWDGPNNRKLLQEMPQILACPSRPHVVKAAIFGWATDGLLACGGGPSAASGLTSYVVAIGRDTVFPGIEPISMQQITDGPSNTILVAESTCSRIPWTKPEDVDVTFHAKLGDREGFFGPHDNGLHALFADGTVRYIKLDRDQSDFDALLTRALGDTVRPE